MQSYKKSARSAFRNIGKKTAWKTWEEMPSITQTFLAMKKNTNSGKIDSPKMKDVQIFFIANYSKNCDTEDINDAW